MIKGIALFVIGACIGAGVVYSAWKTDKAERIASYTELNGKYNELALNPSKPKMDDRFDEETIWKCMSASSLRHAAITARTTSGVMSDVERGAFAPLLPIDLQNQDKSMDARRIALFLEANKLDKECLAGARIKV